MKDIREKYPLLFKDQKSQLNERFDLAWENAKLISKLLKKKYKADYIIVFGSLTDKKRFHKKSDIDLAVSGIDDERFYDAYGEITGKYTEFMVDLVDIEDCNPSFLEVIKKEGIEIE